MQGLAEKLKLIGFSGEVDETKESLEYYSHDASMFELAPKCIVFPKDSNDVQKLIKFITDIKPKQPDLSLTARSAGTDMTGGAINDSIIMDMTKYFNVLLDVTADEATVLPGMHYRDFEKKTLEKGSIMPSYPASRELCTVGGMVANNSGGEKSLEFGKTEKYIKQLKVVFSDGNEYIVKPLSKAKLD